MLGIDSGDEEAENPMSDARRSQIEKDIEVLNEQIVALQGVCYKAVRKRS